MRIQYTYLFNFIQYKINMYMVILSKIGSFIIVLNLTTFGFSGREMRNGPMCALESSDAVITIAVRQVLCATSHSMRMNDADTGCSVVVWTLSPKRGFPHVLSGDCLLPRFF